MNKLSKIFIPTIIGITVYIVVSKLFPEKVLEINPQNNDIRIRGGDIVKNNLIKKIIQKIMQDRALKIAIISVFATAGVQCFNQEIEKLLVDDVFNQICEKQVNGKLKIVCDIIKEHELNLHTKSIRELIVSNNLSRNDKINLLKIKLDFIINGECPGKKRFLILSILAALIAACVSGVGGLALFLEALYRLLQEGKISRAVYDQLVEIVKARFSKVPVEQPLSL